MCYSCLTSINEENTPRIGFEDKWWVTLLVARQFHSGVDVEPPYKTTTITTRGDFLWQNTKTGRQQRSTHAHPQSCAFHVCLWRKTPFSCTYRTQHTKSVAFSCRMSVRTCFCSTYVQKRKSILKDFFQTHSCIRFLYVNYWEITLAWVFLLEKIQFIVKNPSKIVTNVREVVNKCKQNVDRRRIKEKLFKKG